MGVSVSFFNYPWGQLVPTFINTQTLFLSMVGKLASSAGWKEVTTPLQQHLCLDVSWASCWNFHKVGTEIADMSRDCGWELELCWDGIELMEQSVDRIKNVILHKSLSIWMISFVLCCPTACPPLVASYFSGWNIEPRHDGRSSNLCLKDLPRARLEPAFLAFTSSLWAFTGCFCNNDPAQMLG